MTEALIEQTNECLNKLTYFQIKEFLQTTWGVTLLEGIIYEDGGDDGEGRQQRRKIKPLTEDDYKDLIVPAHKIKIRPVVKL